MRAGPRSLGALIAHIDAGTLAAVAIDIPIGLAPQGPRRADIEARQRLGPRRSSVFPAPVRSVLAALTYEEACSLSRAACGKAISKQLFNILPKIREVDALVTPQRQQRLFEMSPELSLAVLAGAPMAHPKTTPAGRAERIDALGPAFGLEEIERHLPGRHPGARGPTTCSTPSPAPGRHDGTPRGNTCSSAATWTSADCAWRWWPECGRARRRCCLPATYARRHPDFPPTVPRRGGHADRSHRCRRARAGPTGPRHAEAAAPGRPPHGPLAGKSALALLALPRRPAPLGPPRAPDRHRPSRAGLRLALRPGLSGAFLRRGRPQHVDELARLHLRRCRPLGHGLGRQDPWRALDPGRLPAHFRVSTSGPSSCPR